MRQLAPVVAVTILLLLTAPAASADLEAGLAVVDMTPKGSFPLAGYSSRFGKMAARVHDPVKARALYLRSGDQRLVWVVCDLVGIAAEMKAAVVARLPAKLGLEPEQILLCGTHTHNGPGGLTKHMYFQFALGFFNQGVHDHVVSRIAQAITAAAGAAAPARIGFGRVDMKGLSRNRRISGGPTDPEMLLLKVTDGTGAKVRAVLANFAAHPTLIEADVLEVSADFPGAFSAAVAKAVPGAVGLFTNGAEGDQSPVAPAGKDGFEKASKFGAELARRAMAALPGIAVSDDVALKVEHKWVKLPPTFMRQFGRTRAPLQRITLGNQLLLSVPGELSVTIGLHLKQIASKLGRTPWIVGLANDHLGYIVDRRLYATAEYESMMNFFGPDMQRFFVSHHLLDLLPSARRSAWAGERDVARLLAGGARSAAGGLHEVRLSGTPYEMGFQHGRLLSKEIREVVAALDAVCISRSKTLFAKAKNIPQAAKFFLLAKRKELALPAMALGARKLHQWVPAPLMEEMLGVAHGSGVPYETIYLLNVYPTLADHPDPEALIKMPLGCANVVLLASDEREALLHGRTLEWPVMTDALARHTTVFRLAPKTGRKIISVGYPGVVGVLTAVTDAGLSFGAESIPAPKDSTFEGQSVHLLLRHVAQSAESLEAAVAALQKAKHPLGYHFTVADGKTAATLEVSATKQALRRPKDGALLGCDPDRTAARFDSGKAPDVRLPQWTASGKGRYAALGARLVGEGASTAAQLHEWLADKPGKLLVPETIQAVVMVPGSGRLTVRAGKLFDRLPKPRVFGFAAQRTTALSDPPKPAAGGKMVLTDLEPSIDLFSVKAGPFKVTKKPIGAKQSRVEFPSPVVSPHPENNTVYGFYYDPGKHADKAVIIMPIWKGKDLTLEKFLANYLSGMGYKVFVMPEAYQFERAPKGVRSGSYTISPDLDRTRKSFIQTVQDARRAATWLQRDEGVKHLAVMGVSLGGVMASLVYAVDKRFKAGLFVLAGGDLGGLMFDSTETDKIRELASKQGVKPDQVRKALRAIEPVTYVKGQSAARGPGVLMIGGTKDKSMPPANVKLLAKAWGVEPAWIPTGHYDAWKHIFRVLNLTTTHLKARLVAPKKPARAREY